MIIPTIIDLSQRLINQLAEYSGVDDQIVASIDVPFGVLRKIAEETGKVDFMPDCGNITINGYNGNITYRMKVKPLDVRLRTMCGCTKKTKIDRVAKEVIENVYDATGACKQRRFVVTGEVDSECNLIYKEEP